MDEVRALASRASSLRVAGSRHSFTDVGDADELLSLNDDAVVFGDGVVTVGAGMTYAAVAGALAERGLQRQRLLALGRRDRAGLAQVARPRRLRHVL